MTHAEQHATIVELIDCARKMSRYDQEEFEMYVKRDKDDEDLDGISQRRLVQLHGKYMPQRRGRA